MMVYLRNRHSEGESWTTNDGLALMQVKSINYISGYNILQIEYYIIHIKSSSERLDNVKEYYNVESIEDLIVHMTIAQMEGAQYEDPYFSLDLL